MQVGFLRYLPHPVTKHATAYTAMRNISMFYNNWKKKCLPVYCDKGVCCIVIDIILKHPTEFESIPMMGGFHMAKAAMRCLGKYLKGCGIEDTHELEAFGQKVVETVFGATHYIRSLRGLMIEQPFDAMKWEASWTLHEPKSY